MMMNEINKKIKEIEKIMANIPDDEEMQTNGETATLRLHKELIIRKFLLENPHEINNEVYGDGISSYGDLALCIRGVHINHHDKRKAKENRELIAEIAEKMAGELE